MTHTNYTKKLLNIEDKNIYFYDDCLETKKFLKVLLMVQTKIYLNI